ncbi:phospholipase D zeta 1-like protein isoform X1, partial [Tanacetum coccineum]
MLTFSLIEKAEHLVYIENQFFISGLAGDEIICRKNLSWFKIPSVNDHWKLIHEASLRQCITEMKGKLGHTTIDLGIDPKKLESYQEGKVK